MCRARGPRARPFVRGNADRDGTRPARRGMSGVVNASCYTWREPRLLAVRLHLLSRRVFEPAAFSSIAHTQHRGLNWSRVHQTTCSASTTSAPPAAGDFANYAKFTTSRQGARAFELPDADTYGGSLGGVGVNLLVSEQDWRATMDFVREVLCLPLATVGPNFAVLRHESVDVLFHREDTYGSSPSAVAERERAGAGARGLGVELRVYNVKPHDIEARANKARYDVLQTTTTKPHGLVECYIQGPGGFVWVPSCPTSHVPARL